MSYLACGSIRLGNGALDDRLSLLFDELSSIIDRYDPVEAAVEKVFMNRNADSALKLGHARGVAIVAARRAGLAISEYSVTQIKQTVVGRGHADKAQVQAMLKILLPGATIAGADAADALAVAIADAHLIRSA